jgi:hypothetical protein
MRDRAPQTRRVVRPDRAVQAADLAEYAEQVLAVEGGEPLPGMTLAESAARLTSQMCGEDWLTAEDREEAQRLVIRLERLRWARTGGDRRTPT